MNIQFIYNKAYKAIAILALSASVSLGYAPASQATTLSNVQSTCLSYAQQVVLTYHDAMLGAPREQLLKEALVKVDNLTSLRLDMIGRVYDLTEMQVVNDDWMAQDIQDQYGECLGKLSNKLGNK